LALENHLNTTREKSPRKFFERVVRANLGKEGLAVVVSGPFFGYSY
jgi:hypothetical protein